MKGRPASNMRYGTILYYELIVQYSVKYVDYVNSTHSQLVLLHMHAYYITFAHVAKSINWPRNSLVCSSSISKDLSTQEAKYRISYLHEAHLANIYS